MKSPEKQILSAEQVRYETIIDYFVKNDLGMSSYRKKVVLENLDFAYDLIINHKVTNITKNTADCQYLLGCYYHLIAKDYNKMKKFYQLAIDQGNQTSMYNLGLYYQNVEKNEQLMKKYYMMAIKDNYPSAIYNLGYYYDEIQNYDEMKKYYKMAIRLNHTSAMYNMGWYYQHIEYDIYKLKKYYLIAVNFCYNDAIYNLRYYFKKCLEIMESSENPSQNGSDTISPDEKKKYKFEKYAKIVHKMLDEMYEEVRLGKVIKYEVDGREMKKFVDHKKRIALLYFYVLEDFDFAYQLFSDYYSELGNYESYCDEFNDLKFRKVAQRYKKQFKKNSFFDLTINFEN